MNYYITQSDLEAYQGITLTANGIALFNLLLPAMQTMVDQFCNRTWDFTNPVTEVFDAMENNVRPYPKDTFYTKCKIAQTPANVLYPNAKGIISMSIQNMAWDLNYVYSYDTFVKVFARASSVILPNPLGYKAVTLVYNSDDAVTIDNHNVVTTNPPAPVKLALVEWIARQIKTAKDTGKEANDITIGTVRVNFKSDSVGALPDFVKLALQPYKFVAMDRF